MLKDEPKFIAENQKGCRICGLANDEALARYKRWLADIPSTAPQMYLCDYCACVSSFCAGTGHANKIMSSMRIGDFSAMLRMLEARLKSG
jgi:hypothetical protein